MERSEFHVCWYRPGARWAAQRGDEICQTYLTREEAVRAAADLAAQQADQDAAIASDVPR